MAAIQDKGQPESRERVQSTRHRYEFHRDVARKVLPALLVSMALNVVLAAVLFVGFFALPQSPIYATVLTGEVAPLMPLAAAED